MLRALSSTLICKGGFSHIKLTTHVSVEYNKNFPKHKHIYFDIG